MNKILIRSFLGAMIVAACAGISCPASARDDVYMLNLNEAMASAQSKLDGSVKFYFGSQAHPGIVRNFGDYVANQKSNAFGKSDVNVCNWVFESALLELQERAQRLGANAVVDIHSYYKKEDMPIDTEIPCHKGFMIAGLALKGKFAKVR
jgi:hypothetical protein